MHRIVTVFRLHSQCMNVRGLCEGSFEWALAGRLREVTESGQPRAAAGARGSHLVSLVALFEITGYVRDRRGP